MRISRTFGGLVSVLLVLFAALLLESRGCTHTMEMRSCNELFVEFPVDAAAAQANLPHGYQVTRRADGNAVLLLMVQDCEQGRLDGVLPVRPLRFSHAWIEVVGPSEMGPTLPGTVRSLSTAYYYASPHQLESLPGFIALTAVGIASEHVQEISLGGIPAAARSGVVIEGRGHLGYRWTETGRPWPEPELVTGRRKFDREFGSLWKRRTKGTVECRSNFVGRSVVVLQAAPDSAVGRLHLGKTLRGDGYRVEMTDCRALIEVRSR